MPIAHSRLLELLKYDRRTGIFRWRVNRPGHARAGDVAGCVNVHGYVQIGVDGGRYLAHQLAVFYVTGEWVPEVDHRNRDGIDNRWRNIRPASRSQNQGNKAVTSANTSGVKGVSWDEQTNRWRAKISINGATKHLGRFDLKSAAAAAYRTAAEAHFGEFARLR